MRSKRCRIFTSVILAALIAAAALIGWTIGSAEGTNGRSTPSILCKPNSRVNVRRTPNKGAEEVGYLEVGDEILTDGTSRNGFIRVYGIGEYGEGWVYCGYVVSEKPAEVFENYVCVAKNRVACRRWVSGPQVSGSPWLANGSNVTVFYIAGEWALTSRGYIQREWLEVDPE